MRNTIIKKWMYLCLILIFILIIAAGQSAKDGALVNGQRIETENDDQLNTGDVLREEQYRKDGIEASYPQFTSSPANDKQKLWNQIIKKDFDKILQIYSFNPFPEPTPVPTGAVPVILKITYEVKLNNDKFISIFYKAAYNSPYSAHPSELVYTTNIDKKKDKRIKLSDMVNLNSDFAKDFKGWDFITYEKGNELLNTALRDYRNEISEKDILLGLRTADQIGSKNPWGIFSYLTPDRLGISISVPHYAGDHVEFEKKYAELIPFLKPGF